MRTAILFCDDIFFSSKVEAAGRAVERDIVVVQNLAQLNEELGDQEEAAETRLPLLVDLECSNAKLADIIEAVGGFSPEPHLIGFAGHRLTDVLNAARDAGFQTVLTRGQFDEQVMTLLADD